MIDGIKGSIGTIPALPLIDQPNKVEPQGKGQSFSDALKSAIAEVGDMQNEADKKIQGLVTGDKGVTPHDAMIALQKADVAFQLMSAIRTKIVAAYQEVVRTQV